MLFRSDLEIAALEPTFTPMTEEAAKPFPPEESHPGRIFAPRRTAPVQPVLPNSNGPRDQPSRDNATHPNDTQSEAPTLTNVQRRELIDRIVEEDMAHHPGSRVRNDLDNNTNGQQRDTSRPPRSDWAPTRESRREQARTRHER